MSDHDCCLIHRQADPCAGCLSDQLTRLKRAIRDILVDENGHYYMELSGADVIQDLTSVGEQFGCLDGASEP